MTERTLQITYRKGRPFAGYLHLPHTADGERNRSVATSNGVLVVDYNTADEPIGIKITAPQNVSAELLNDVLSSLGQPALVDNEFAPLTTGQDDVLVHELKSLAPDVVTLLDQRDAASRLLEALPTKYPTSQMGQVNPTRAWELTALWFFQRGRVHEALSLFWRLYQHMVSAQDIGRIHKGMPLVWLSECYGHLGFPVHAKRYLMLTLCEDAIREGGVIAPNTSGVYFRLVWGKGLPDSELKRYANRFFELHEQNPEASKYPEELLRQVDDRWLIEAPSPPELGAYIVNSSYVAHLLSRLGDGSGRPLEDLAEYLMASMPGCRTQHRQRSGSTDYDIVCSMEGFDVDFRSDLGRYFVCECKDWKSPADFTVMAKFCRVLDSIKSRFGVLFSKNGLSGVSNSQFAAREQLKVFQDRGIVIVVIDEQDLKSVAAGANLTQLLRRRYEAVRLDLRGSAGVDC
jgi:hypothetical protein